MIIQSPGAIAFYIGEAPIHWYGILLASALIVSMLIAINKTIAWKVSNRISTCIYSIIFSFTVGYMCGRLYYVVLNWNYFSEHSNEILQVWNGGLAIHGAILGALVAGAFVCNVNKLPFLTCCDIGAICIPLFQAIVRWGNFFNSEGYGLPVNEDFPLKLYISPENRIAGYESHDYFHPTFLYESVFDFLIFLVMFCFLSEKLRKYPGVGFLVYISLYSLGRFFIELLRIGDNFAFGVPVACLVSVIIIVLSLPAIFVLLKRKMIHETVN